MIFLGTMPVFAFCCIPSQPQPEVNVPQAWWNIASSIKIRVTGKHGKRRQPHGPLKRGLPVKPTEVFADVGQWGYGLHVGRGSWNTKALKFYWMWRVPDKTRVTKIGGVTSDSGYFSKWFVLFFKHIGVIFVQNSLGGLKCFFHIPFESIFKRAVGNSPSNLLGWWTACEVCFNHILL